MNLTHRELSAMRYHRLQRLHGALFLCSVLIVAEAFPGNRSSGSPAAADLLLQEGWHLRSSEFVKEGGQTISSPSYSPSDWYPTSVPTTVLGALTRNMVYTDIWMGDNFARIPSAQFKKAWWFRKEFSIPTDRSSVTLAFDGIIYRANVWLNGTQIASADTTAGVYRRFEFNISNIVRPGATNVLAVEVFPPIPGEPSVGFVDWNPRPPDQNMGIWRNVRVRCTGQISMGEPFVRSDIDEQTMKRARLTVSTELHNRSAKTIEGTLKGTIGSIHFSMPVELAPGETKLFELRPADFPQLEIENPRLWWSHDVGTPALYSLHLEAAAFGSLSDARDVRFGIRRISDYISEDGHRGYKLNGRKIQIRGGGWTDDLLLEPSRERVEAQLAYVRHMRLNTIRSEGMWGTDELFDLCDEMGILIMYGYSCQWEWQDYLGKKTDRRYGGITSRDDIALVSRMWKDQVLWLRNHPSIFVWVYASDLIPAPELERKYIDILKMFDPDRPSLASAAMWTSQVTGPTAVKMLGPYEYVPPVYWYVDSTRGGAYGFNTETGPGAQVPPLESVVRMIPRDSLWPQNGLWSYHCSRNEFGSLARYNVAMDHRIGKALTVDEYCIKAQFLNYEGMRAMFEAFTGNKHYATGIIQWMLNSAWPKLFWQLYDYYLMPTGAFYGAKAACRPVNIQYNYGNRSISLVNNTFDEVRGLTATVKVLNFDLSEKFSGIHSAALHADQSLVILTLPEISGLSRTYFVDARLYDSKKRLLSANFYPLSTHPDILVDADTSQQSWYTTPERQYADLTELSRLKQVRVREGHEFSSTGDRRGILSISLANPDRNLAFCIELMVKKGKDGEPVLPIFFDDNYVSLLPGEQRTVRATFDLKDLGDSPPYVQVRGWNTGN